MVDRFFMGIVHITKTKTQYVIHNVGDPKTYKLTYLFFSSTFASMQIGHTLVKSTKPQPAKVFVCTIHYL